MASVPCVNTVVRRFYLSTESNISLTTGGNRLKLPQRKLTNKGPAMYTQVIIKHGSMEDLKRSALWAEVIAAFWSDDTVSVVFFCDHDTLQDGRPAAARPWEGGTP